MLIGFFIGFIVGGIVGITWMSCCTIAGRSDDNANN